MRSRVSDVLLCAATWHVARSFVYSPTQSFLLRRRFHNTDFCANSSSSNKISATLSEQDETFLAHAISHAKLGVGFTFPNPAVGCILIRNEDQALLGAGFHPRAGYPHAEIFALLEAAGHLPSGMQAAQSVVDGHPSELVQSLSDAYAQEGGPQQLFENLFDNVPVTAYVTLEPCCHFGKTPPCASSLAISKVNRVVVGFRDPNPRVDGGGVKHLLDSGITVDTADESSSGCVDLVRNFVKRITPNSNYDTKDYGSWINGARRRALRSLAGRKKADGTLPQINFYTSKRDVSDEDAVDVITLEPQWMENLDTVMWEHELVNLRLSQAVGKKKLARRLAERIAQELGAHVAQTIGHTALLYRPGSPPILDFDQILQDSGESPLI